MKHLHDPYEDDERCQKMMNDEGVKKKINVLGSSCLRIILTGSLSTATSYKKHYIPFRRHVGIPSFEFKTEKMKPIQQFHEEKYSDKY